MSATGDVKKRTVWILAGEASGDLFGAYLAQALRDRRGDLTVRGMGGPRMAEAGVDILVDSTDLGVVGFVEVVRHLGLFRRLFRQLVDEAERTRPDAVVLIDYPGFNLRFARQMHARGIRCVYYVSPQVWAWGKHRIPKMAAILDLMLVIFPFEEDVWRETTLPCRFVGHPLLEILGPERVAPEAREEDLVLLLPGSRGSEVDRLVAPLLATAAALRARHPHLRFALPTPRPAIRDRVAELIAAGGHDDLGIELTCGDTTDWMRRATVGLAASGTVTVQSAILGLPLVVVYRTNPITFFLGKLLVDIPWITMVNLVTGREVFEEFLQGDVCPRVLVPAVERILPGGPRREAVIAGMAEAIAALGAGTEASSAAADAVLELIAVAEA